MNIRDATAEDLDGLVALNNEVQVIHASLFPDIFRETDDPAVRQRFEEQMGDPLITALVAESEDRLVGYAMMRMFNRDVHLYCHARSCAYVDQIGVAADFRKQGIGRALIDEAARRAKEMGMSRLELDVWTDNVSAKAAFLALGFNPYNEKMYMSI